MPSKNPQWCDIMGNPSKSKVVNKFMRHVLKLDVRGMDALSHVKQTLTKRDFLLELEFMWDKGVANTNTNTQQLIFDS